MEPDLRASLIVAVAAAGLSMFVGLLSRVDFLPLLLRALVLGAALGGLCMGTLFLLRRNLPELFGGAPAADGVAFDEETGSFAGEALGGTGGNVDIVLGPDADESLLAISDDGVGAPPAAVGRGDRAEEVEEAVDVDAEEAGSVPLIEIETEAAESGGPGARPDASFQLRPGSGPDDLDVLPDLDSLAGGFGQQSPDPRGTSSKSRDPGASASRGPSAGAADGADPATLAMAVRTLLKRDQKG